MKIYYKGVLFRNWLRIIKQNKHNDKRKVSEFFTQNIKNKFFMKWRSQFQKNNERNNKFQSIMSNYFYKVKKISWRTLKIETKYKEM